MGQEVLSLPPCKEAIEGIVLYESRNWLYVVGSNTHGDKFRMLRIDRNSLDLVVHDDQFEYSREQLRQTLAMIGAGSALYGKISAHAILGFIRFLEGYYIVLITQRRRVALLGSHYLFKIEETTIIPVVHASAHVPRFPDEARYLKIFQTVDLSSNFYYSHTYDLTHSLQYNMTRGHELDTSQSQENLSRFKAKFLWNSYLLKPFVNQAHKEWIIPVIHGFLSQAHISALGKPIYVLLIARRSRRFAGTRFLKRGANEKGWVANDVESEQIVHDATRLAHDTGLFTSFRQMRGSIPLFWSQDTKGMAPKPPIMIDRMDPYYGAAALHFDELFRDYGTPVHVVNVVKQKEKKPRESILHDEFSLCIMYLNKHLPPDRQIIHQAFDMARCSKSRKNVLDQLASIGNQSLRGTGFFHSGPQLNINRMREEAGLLWRVGGIPYGVEPVGRRQSGIARVNCIDCLDRTNTVEFMIGKCAFGHQLFALGVIEEPFVDIDCAAARVLKSMYEDHGDTIALQYGGSQLVNTLETYRQTSPWTSNTRDILHTIQRYYSNSFTDADKQNAINLFLGIFVPQEHRETRLWELTTDYYLHHYHPRCGYIMPMRSYSSWWTASLNVTEERQPLELFEHEQRESFDLDSDDEEEYANSNGNSQRAPPSQTALAKDTGTLVSPDSSDAKAKVEPAHEGRQPFSLREYYNEQELTCFKEGEEGLFAFNMVNCLENVKGPSDYISPFLKLVPSNLQQVVSKQQEMFGVERWIDTTGAVNSAHPKREPLGAAAAAARKVEFVKKRPIQPVSMLASYGCEVKEFVESTSIYDRYAHIHIDQFRTGPKMNSVAGVVMLPGGGRFSAKISGNNVTSSNDAELYAEVCQVGVSGPLDRPDDKIISYLSIDELFDNLQAQ